LTSPADLSSASPPVAFSWVKRTATTDDSYEFYLYSNDSDPDYYSGPLGDVDQYTLDSLPAGFDWNTSYVWDVTVYNPAGGFGESFEIWAITFNNTGDVASAQLTTRPVGAVDKEKPFRDK
jgi:hypothetical protein